MDVLLIVLVVCQAVASGLAGASLLCHGRGGMLHSRRGAKRKDRRAERVTFVRYREPVPHDGPLSGEDAMRLLENIEDPRGRAEAVARICRQVGRSGAVGSGPAGGAA